MFTTDTRATHTSPFPGGRGSLKMVMPVSHHFIAKQAAGPSPGTVSHGLMAPLVDLGPSHQVIIDNRSMRGVDDPAAGSPTLLL